ncbi:MAG: hypothetical protein PVH88_02540 [Ignavibacteria bacterium]|jgi:hypothetical protein
MKTKNAFPILLIGIIAFYFVICNSNENSLNSTENQISPLTKLIFGQNLLLEAKENNISVHNTAVEELLYDWSFSICVYEKWLSYMIINKGRSLCSSLTKIKYGVMI